MATILLIEPDRILGNIYCLALEAAGHKAVVCPGAQSGVLVADQIKPDLAIIELQLVEHSGIEFLYEFRSYADWQHIPVIIHSQVPPSEFADNLPLLTEQLGVTSYLYKPQTSLKELIEIVNEQLAVPA
jgi:DNA-binding response OmpR family regulator